MNLPKKLTSWRKALPILLRCLAIALAVALVGALAVGASWRAHRPIGYSGSARVSSTLSPDFASGFDVAWELTASDRGCGRITARVSGGRWASRRRLWGEGSALHARGP